MADMLSKSAQTLLKVAVSLCGIPVGSKIPTVSELEASCESSRGNIQKALSTLKQTGAVELEAHGQSGTFLTFIDYLALARALGTQHLTGTMPLPYTLRYEGLATSLYTLLNADGIRAYITFLRGSEARVQMLLDESADYAVMSRMAFEEYVAAGLPIQAAVECEPLSYVGHHVVLLRGDGPDNWAGARVGIDESSVDQRTLTRRYFEGKDVRYVDVQYTQIINLLMSGDLDAGIWNEDDVHVRAANLKQIPVDAAVTSRDNTRAVVVVRGDDPFTRELLKALATPAQIEKLQQQVMQGELAVRY